MTIERAAEPVEQRETVVLGEASENTEVVVHVFLKARRSREREHDGVGRQMVDRGPEKALASGKHTFTAKATEKSGLGNADGESTTVSFEVSTESPAVTIVGPPSPSNNRRPAFSGNASEPTEVVVHVFEGATEVASAKTTASGGKWSTSGAALSKELPSGKHSFTAKATEKSGLGNADGESAVVSFEVNTQAPVVTIKRPPSPSNNTNPSFEGTASENTEVVVHVLEGETEVASAKTTASGGKWSTSGLSKALPAGKHTLLRSSDREERAREPRRRKRDGRLRSQHAAARGENHDCTAGSVEQHESIVRGYGERKHGSGGARVRRRHRSGVGENHRGGRQMVDQRAEQSAPDGTHSFTAHATEKSGLGNADGTSENVSFEVDTLPPEVTITAPPSPSKNTSPSFSGEASENTEVVVHVFLGAEEVASAKTTASGGSWSTSGLSKALATGKHTFTAKATEKSGIGNSDGESETVSFEVNTEAPVVTLNQPTTPSNNTNPSFSGNASENTEVTVHVFEGETEVASAKTTASGGTWSTSGLSKVLASGKHTFTAKAVEKSGLGNGDGTSETRTFEVNTEAPVVTLNQPTSPSNNTKPAFSGNASENTEVVVHVFLGAEEVASASTTASGGKWSTAALAKALVSGKHTFTAKATEKSGLGNLEGTSETRTFEVNTEPPVVTIVAPPSPSNNTKPAFSGNASENTEVVVHVFEGATEVASAKTTASGGKWSTSGAALSKELPVGKHTFKVFANEKSGLGNADGKSSEPTFEVNTEPPVVTITQPLTPSNNTKPSFEGTASENTEVVVHVFEGATEVASAKTTAAGGKWSTSGSSLSKALASGKQHLQGLREREERPRQRRRQEQRTDVRSQHANRR